MKGETSKLRKYFLGELSGPEAEEIDLRILADPDFEGELRLAEHELIEDYLEGSLSEPEIQAFVSNFLVTVERKDLLEEVAVVKRYAAARRSNAEPISSGSSGSRIADLKRWFPFRKPVFVGAATLLALLVATGLIWTVLDRNSARRLTDLEAEYSKKNKDGLDQLEKYRKLSGVTLSPGLFRGGDSAQDLQANDLTEDVYFRLSLPPEIASIGPFRADILRQQTQVFYQPDVRVYENLAGREVRLLLPRSILQAGQYEIRILDPGTEQVISAYGFRVQ